MGAFAAGQVVTLPYPFSDLTRTKVRPAVVLAVLDQEDLVLCQITSNPYRDRRAVELRSADFAAGSLRLVSYARPCKLFTGNARLLIGSCGTLTSTAFINVLDAAINVLLASRP